MGCRNGKTHYSAEERVPCRQAEGFMVAGIFDAGCPEPFKLEPLAEFHRGCKRRQGTRRGEQSQWNSARGSCGTLIHI
jgi:hypothetical protein